MEKSAAGLGVKVIMPAAPADDNADDAFEYWEDGHEAILCFQCYLSDQWIYGFSGPAALDTGKALSVIEKLYRKPAKQLQLLEEVKAFAAGVLNHFFEQQKKS